MRAAMLLVAVFLVAGCVSSPLETHDPEPPLIGESPRPTLSFRGCDELDYYIPEDATQFDMGGLEPVYVDPAARLVNLLLTAMACNELEVDNESAHDIGAFFAMVAVEPHPTLRLDGVSAYVWMAGVATDIELLTAGFGPKLANDTAQVDLSFSALGPNPKAQATLVVTDSGATFGAQSVMVGQASAGGAGQMAAYIGDSTSGLELYRISFSDYRSYPTGVARGSGFSSLVPIPVAHDYVYPAYHNLDYDVVFAPVDVA